MTLVVFHFMIKVKDEGMLLASYILFKDFYI